MSHASSRSHVTASAPLAEVFPQALEVLAPVGLPDFLLRQRRYPAKDAGRPPVALSALLPLPGSGVSAGAALWRVSPPGHAPLLLFVRLALVAAEAATLAQVIAPPPDITYGSRGVRLAEAFFSMWRS